MTKEQARAEINLRIDRETSYVLRYSCLDRDNFSGRVYLASKINDNQKAIEYLGAYLKSEFKDKWEIFYDAKKKEEAQYVY